MTKQFVTFILAQPNTHYLTNDELTPYKLISRNRIYDLDWITKMLQEDEEDNTDDDEE